MVCNCFDSGGLPKLFIIELIWQGSCHSRHHGGQGE
jgi:hypothetical protein